MLLTLRDWWSILINFFSSRKCWFFSRFTIEKSEKRRGIVLKIRMILIVFVQVAVTNYFMIK